MDKMPSADIKIENKFTKWLDNFWYHYKWPMIGIVFAAFVLIVCTLQLCERESSDTFVMYAGPDTFTEEEKFNNIKGALKAVLPEDFNGDGEKVVTFVSNFIMSEEEIKKAKAEREAEGYADFYVDTGLISNNKKNFDNLIMAGEYSVCMLSPYLYESVKESDAFVPLDEIFDYEIAGAIDECGIKLSETDFGRYFPGVNTLPEDTVLCMRRMSPLSTIINKGTTEKEYARSMKLFCAIVEYKAP